MTRTRYRKRPELAVTAVRLALDTEGFAYHKWGERQHCKRGDWLVENHEGDVYSIDADSFAATYSPVSPGRYVKRAPVWAERMEHAGSVPTREGVTRYAPGDYLVSNEADGGDAYAVPGRTFESSYESIDDEPPSTKEEAEDEAGENDGRGP